MRKKAEPPTPPSADDLWLDELRRECAMAIVEYLKGVNPLRPIRSLTLDELMGAAEACTARWIVMVSRRRAEAPQYEAVEISLI